MSSPLPCLLGGLAVALAVTAPLAAQAHLADRAADRELARTISRSPQVVPNVLCVKLIEGSGAVLVDGRLRSRVGMDLAAPAALLARGRLLPLFAGIALEQLDRMHATACANLLPKDRPGHLGLWFRCELPTVAAADQLFELLWDQPLIEHVVKQALPTPAAMPITALLPGDIPPPTPLFTSLQGSFDPSPVGHSFWQAQGILGARGQGIGFHMVEQEWHFDHEDVSQCVAANVFGTYPPPGGEAGHGTAGASVITADRNEYGITGIADEVGLRFYSTTTNVNLETTLLIAGTQCQPGDVIMVVMMYNLAQVGGTDWVPFEILQPVFDATATLTGNGCHVVVASGNGDNSLDDPRFVRRFDRTFRDSGAVFAAATDGASLSKAHFSNFGSRIDANSWGDDVCACGIPTLFYPNQDIRQSYTADYTGTSSAVPGVAGLVAAIQGAAERQLGARLTNDQVRPLLWTHGPLSPDSIGRRPDLQAILAAIGAADGLAVAHPDVPIGASEDVTITGPAGSGAFLFAAFDAGSTDLGFNRRIHLALPGILTVGFVPMPAGAATFQIDIPNDIGLRGLDLFLQAGVLQAAAPVHVTNSGQLTII